MTLVIHFNPRSTYSRRVRIAVIEKGIEHELSPINMAAGEHKTQSYLSLNPYGRVPTIEHDGFVLYESTAILSYLDTVFPGPALFPADPRDRARTEMHMKLCDIEFARPAGIILFPKRFLPPERWDRKAFAEAQVAIEKHLRIVSGELGERAFLIGDRFSAADIVYLPLLHFLPLLELFVPDSVQAWANGLLSRPSAVETRPDR